MDGIYINTSGVYENHTINSDVVIKADYVTLKNLNVNGKITVEGTGACIFGCTVTADDNAIVSCARDLIVRSNKINCCKNSILLQGGSHNVLIAQNETRGRILAGNAFNCAVILNDADAIVGEGSTNLYVIDNKTDSIEVKGNQYLICDGNRCDTVINENNALYNGDDLQDVDSRLEYGADENLLPHTNKDLFVGMERRETVNAPDYETYPTINEYIISEATKGGVVIVPPGVYVSRSLLTLSDISDVTIYAYGVYHEAVDYMKSILIKTSRGVMIKGLTVGYARVSTGQMQIVKKLGDNKLLMIASAGFPKKIGRLDPDTFGSGGGYFFRADSFIDWTELGNWGYYKLIENEDGNALNEDGTFVVEIVSRDERIDYYSMLKKGDFLAGRIKGGGGNYTLCITSSENLLFKDTVTYGYCGALCIVVGGTSKGVEFYRHHNLAHSGYEIDEDTYDRYKAIGEKYGVDLQVYIDELGRYRGAASRLGSIDATHISGASEGLNATSTLFENACDDATNQRGYSSSLHKVTDNNDGTYSLLYKDYMAWVYYFGEKRAGHTENPGFHVAHFVKGDRIFAYASNGRILCDTTVLSDAEVVDECHVMHEEDFEYQGEIRHLRWVCKLRSVRVNASDVDLGALEGYNTEISHYTMDDKVIVDNISRNSAFFTLDNCMVRHNHGRVLVKTHYGSIKNCTFIKTSYAGVMMSAEPTWGESSVPNNVTVSRCIFDRTSQYFDRNTRTKFAAVAVEGLGSGDAKVTVKPGYIPSRNITVEKNIFRNIPNDFYVTASAVDGLVVKDNIFEPGEGESEGNARKVIYVNGCMNVNISGNTYSYEAARDLSRVIVAENYQNLYGSDVEGIFPKDNASCEKEKGL